MGGSPREADPVNLMRRNDRMEIKKVMDIKGQIKIDSHDKIRFEEDTDRHDEGKHWDDFGEMLHMEFAGHKIRIHIETIE